MSYIYYYVKYMGWISLIPSFGMTKMWRRGCMSMNMSVNGLGAQGVPCTAIIAWSTVLRSHLFIPPADQYP
jgi:hypothetical protein